VEAREAAPIPGHGLLALLGPTASGKTEASVAVAEALSAEILCVDSMLVYRGMDVGTAKPSAAQRARVPHHLLDLADPSEPFSASRFQSAARRAIDEIGARGRRSLLVGSGGLYYRAVADGLRFPGTETATRRALEAEALAVGPGGLHARLLDLDPAAAAKIAPENVRRTVRALEVAAVTGRRFSSFAADWDRYPVEAVRAVGVDVPKEVINRRIERRVQGMLSGLVAETVALLQRGFGGFLTSTQAIGYAEAVALLEGAVGQDEAITRIVRRTNALARRQLAWLRRDPRVRWFPAGEGGATDVVEEIVRYLRRGDRPRRHRATAEVGA
jgi:tRNA dimethylallyltransferase